MKTSIKAFITIVALGASALFVQAQPVLKVGTLDLAKALGGYYKTQDEQGKIQAYAQDAQKNIEKLLNEGRQMAAQLQSQAESLKNPVLSDAAKKTAEADAQRLYAEVQKKEQEINEFRQQADRFIQQGLQTTRQQLIGEIAAIASEIAKKKGITLLVERNNALVYGDPGFDITDEVLVELNKNKPATSGTSAASAVPSVGLPAKP